MENKKKDQIEVIIKRPGELPQKATITNRLENLQAIVGGYIEAVTLASDFAIICNEDGRLMGLPYNCDICGVSFVGPIIFVGIDGEEFTNAPGSVCNLFNMKERNYYEAS